MPRVDVLGDVEQVPPDTLRIDHVRGLHHRRQRDAPVGDVQVVVRADAPVDAEQQANDAEVAAVVGRRLHGELGREHAARHRRRQRAENVVEALEATVNDHPDGAAALGGDLLDGRPCVHLAAKGDDSLLERVDDRLVTAVEPAHDLAATLVARRAHPARARPDVRGRQVLELAVELGVEERLPQPFDDSASTQAPQPFVQRLVVQRVVPGGELTASDEERQPRALVRAEQREGQELLRRGHREEPAIAVEADLRRPEAPVVAESELGCKTDNPIVARQHDVVEAIDRRAVEVEGADEPAEVRCALVERDGDACLGEPVCGGHPEDAAADDPDARPHAPSTPSLAAGT